jgi:hypothetical protein
MRWIITHKDSKSGSWQGKIPVFGCRARETARPGILRPDTLTGIGQNRTDVTSWRLDLRPAAPFALADLPGYVI